MSTETFPYTLQDAERLLSADKERLVALCNTLGIQLYRNERTGNLHLKLQDFDKLQQALNPPDEIPAVPATLPQKPAQSAVTASSPALPQKSYSSMPQRSAAGGGGKTDLSVIVDTVSNVKEGILKELSQLLDDKLSGLDDIVVELIRSKSENDNLREELKRLEQNQHQLQIELTKFKPAAFGFYRKER